MNPIKRKITAFLILCALLISTWQPVKAAATYTTGTYKVTASSLNVRKGPGTSYSKLGSLSSGSTVKVTSVSNNWGKIDYKGKTGWVSLSYCTKVSSTTTDGSTTGGTGTVSGTGTKYRITASSLNVRSGPGTGYSKIGSVKSGTTVTVLSTSNNWGKINYNSKTGWISLNAKYVAKVTESTVQESKKPNGFAKGAVIRTDGEASYNTTGLNLVAHRGSSDESLENTLVAYQNAGEQGFWGIEGDLRAYSSTTLAMGHDGVNASSCLFTDYLAVCKQYGCVAVIDLKSGLSTANLKKAVDLVREKGLLDQAIFQTANTTYLDTIRGYASDVHIWYLAMTATQMENALTVAEKYNIEGIDVFKELEGVSDYISKYKAAGLKVSCNTFEEGEELKTFVEYGCDYPMYDK